MSTGVGGNVQEGEWGGEVEIERRKRTGVQRNHVSLYVCGG